MVNLIQMTLPDDQNHPQHAWGDLANPLEPRLRDSCSLAWQLDPLCSILCTEIRDWLTLSYYKDRTATC